MALIPENVLDVISFSLAGDWKRFGRLMRLEESQIECIDLENDLVYEKCRQVLKECTRKQPSIEWDDVRVVLEQINRNDVVKKCEKIEGCAVKVSLNSTMEKSFEKAKEQLRERYLHQYKCLFNENSNEQHNLDRISAFVELAISSSNDVHEYWSRNSDRDYHLNQHLFKGKTITIEDIMCENKDLVCLGGVAGSGKSTLLLYMLLKWARQELWTGSVGQQFDFVFTIICREINFIENCSSLESILKKLYPKVFQLISFEQLLLIADKVLVIVDGVDEFIGLDDMISQQDGSQSGLDLSRSLFQAVNPLHPSLFRHKVLISGRPEAISKVQKRFQKIVDVRSIEVLGFNNENVALFVQSYFSNNRQQYQTVLQKIKESTNLSVMASLPVYLSIICNLFFNESNATVNTSVELFCWALGLYLKDHFRGKAVSTMNLRELFKQEFVRNMLAVVAAMAYEMLCCGTVVFDADSLSGQFEESLEYCGLVTKVFVDEFTVKYQFRHLSLQEFCAAAHILRKDIPRKDVINNNRLRGCVPLLCGLESVFSTSSNSPPILKAIVHAMEVQNLTQEPVLSYLVDNLFSYGHQPCVLTGSNDAWNLFATSYYEHHKPLNQSLKSVISKSEIILYLKNISRIQMTFMIYFLDQIIAINPFPVQDIYLQVWRNDVSESECKRMAKYICLTKRVHIERMNVLLPDDLKLINNEFESMTEKKATPAIKELRFYACKLSSHHLFSMESVLTNLHTLVLSYNKNISLDGWKLVASLFETCCFLQKLHVRDCNLKDHAFASLAAVAPKLLEFEVSDNPSITNQGWIKLVESVNNGSVLEKLYLRGCYLTDSSLESLLPVFTYLKELDLSFNKAITYGGWNKLCDFFLQGKGESLQRLCIKNCFVTQSSIEVLKKCMHSLEHSVALPTISNQQKDDLNDDGSSQMIKIKCNLNDGSLKKLCKEIQSPRRIDLSSNENITTLGWQHLANSVQSKTSNLEELVLCDCNLKDDDVLVLSPLYPGLKKLRLSKNPGITNVGWNILGSIKRDAAGRFLKGLNLRSCRLNDSSMAILQPILGHLNYLSLGNNSHITPIGWKCLSTAVIDSKKVCLKFLSVRDCDINDASLKEIQPVIPFLHSLKLGGNLKITPVGWKGIGECINNEICNLYELGVIRCLLTDEDLITLLPLLPFLQMFDVRFNRCITTIGWKLLSSAVRKHPSAKLKSMNIHGCFISNSDLKSLLEVVDIV
ncbi:NACHT, LRR and PYD domains-containing protein 9-like [Hydractinia symbiolongicarpus]|uniref:NACHT, LRR and PYD domains-containing protein 9-like n=1 Tax=Hydractinia symbiolongicarpus TaxID=13093 RepID=UPI00254C0D3A|nr:NACHT, LRR and PYD domains-containing protein 9-like [Hydractinia symbiolongicarpus]